MKIRPRTAEQKQNIQFTKEGYEALKKEFADLEAARPTAVQELATARAMGDLSENAGYTAARRKLSHLDGRIRRIKAVLRRAEVAAPPPDGEVGLGSKVVLLTPTGEITYTIVGGQESDLTKGWLSQWSPVGKALMGKKENEDVAIFVPAGKIMYKIISIQN